MRSRSLAGYLALSLAVVPGLALADPPPPALPAKAAAAPAAAPAKPAAAAKPAAKGAAGGKAALAKKKKKKVKDAPVTGPIATYPGFRMLDGGGSRVFVTPSQKVGVTEHKAEGKLTYRIAGVQVPTHTNTLPLLTGFFSTPVSKAVLVEHDGDVDLVIDVKDAKGAQFRIVESDKGAELQVDFPKVVTDAVEAASTAPDTGAAAPASTGRPAAAKSLDSKSENAY